MKMEGLTRFSVRHPVTVISILAAFAIAGLVSVFIIPVDFLPKLSSRSIILASEYEGLPAMEMRALVAIPVEDAFASMKGLKNISSTIRDSLVLTSLELHWGSDMDIAMVESREIINACYENLPSGCKKPVIIRNDFAKRDTMTMAIIPKDGDLKYARHLAEKDIKPRLQRLPGVGSVSMIGGEEEEIHVNVFRDKAESRKLSIQNLADAITASNFEYPAGTIKEGDREYTVKTSGLFSSLEEMGRLALAYNSGGLLRLEDVAELKRAAKQKDSFFLLNGQECIKLGLRAKSGNSPLQMSAAVKSELKLIEQAYGSWYDFYIIEDLSKEIRKSLSELLAASAAGMLVTAVVLWFFFGSPGLSILLSSIIPLSAGIAVLILCISGKSLNIMSLSGIAIGIGMVVDAGTIVAENIQKALPDSSGNIEETVIIAACSVSKSNTGSALTTIIVFIPVFFLDGILEELFADLALALISSIGISCLLSMSYIPSVCAQWGKSFGRLQALPLAGHFVRKAENKYRSLLTRLLQKPQSLVFLIAAILAVGIASAKRLEYRILPELGSHMLTAEVCLPAGSSIHCIQKSADEISRALIKESSISTVCVSGGLEAGDFLPLLDPGEQAEKIRITVAFAKASKKNADRIQKLLDYMPIKAQFGKSPDLLSQLLDLDDERFILIGSDPDSVYEQAVLLAGDSLKFIPRHDAPEMVFKPDRLAVARFSISAKYLANAARNAIDGAFAAPYYENGREIAVKISFVHDDKTSVQDLENTMIHIGEGSVPLKVLGNLSIESAEKTLYRYNKKDAKILYGLPGALGQDTQHVFSPASIELGILKKSAVILLLLTVLMLYLLMAAQFESFFIPLLLLVALPPAFSGAFLFLLISGKGMNINGIIAIVVLFGCSVNNSILLYENCISKKPVTVNSVVDSSVSKLRAILITNMTTIVAIVPFAFDFNGTNAQSSMSVAIVGGMLFSTILVLLAVPVLLRFVLAKKRCKA